MWRHEDGAVAHKAMQGRYGEAARSWCVRVPGALGTGGGATPPPGPPQMPTALQRASRGPKPAGRTRGCVSKGGGGHLDVSLEI